MDKILLGLGWLILALMMYFGLDAFFGLVSGLYIFLDGYIWAFFAGIIAFFLAISIVGIMIQISIVVLSLGLVGIASIAALFENK